MKMAGIVDQVMQCTTNSQDLAKLVHNPMFTELQVTLASDCSQVAIPYTLLQGEEKASPSSEESLDLVVEDATLQAEFRQLGQLQDPKVSELEFFYNTQSAGIVTERSDAISLLQAKDLPPDQLQHEIQCINEYYDCQQSHLTLRISKSLQLLKCALPNELALPGGHTKKSKQRLLNARAVGIMTTWYDKHPEHPYPNQEDKEEMASAGGISLAQVKAWFANKRNRTLNTKPKRQKLMMQKRLTHISDNFAPSQGKSVCASKEQNYNVLLQELSHLVQNTSHRYGNFNRAVSNLECLQVN